MVLLLGGLLLLLMGGFTYHLGGGCSRRPQVVLLLLLMLMVMSGGRISRTVISLSHEGGRIVYLRACHKLVFALLLPLDRLQMVLVLAANQTLAVFKSHS